MLIDSSSSTVGLADLKADYVIVGAGTVGLFLAAVISERKPKASVILLEGGSKVATASRNFESAISTGKRHNGVLLGRACGLGGTSALWGGQLAEFEERDFRRDDAQWPFGLAEIQPYYDLVYRMLGIVDVPSDHACRQALGDETPVVQSDGVERFFTRWLKTPNLAKYFQPFLESKRVTCYLNISAVGIKFDGSGADVVRCTTSSGKLVNVAGANVVFATGTISTVRFFLTTQKFDDVPWKTNTQIGAYFQDHLGGKVASARIINEKLFREYFENGFVHGCKVQPKLRFTKDLREQSIVGGCIFFGFDSSLSSNIRNIKTFVKGLRSGLAFSSGLSVVRDFFTVGRSLLPIAARFIRDRRILALMDKGVTALVQAEQIPVSSSRIAVLGNERASDGLLKASVAWDIDGRELAAIKSLVTEADNYLSRLGLARLEIDPALMEMKPEFIADLSDTYHQCGGMRMSSTAPDGVVDPNCKVWGASNVWVVGASVFPSSSHANCTLTALALAARLGVHLTS